MVRIASMIQIDDFEISFGFVDEEKWPLFRLDFPVFRTFFAIFEYERKNHIRMLGRFFLLSFCAMRVNDQAICTMKFLSLPE